ncbi:MAG TPA: BREX system ATP-binding domain-containing protein [Jatrophihabitantaceae bacterium]|nr:BREX system ATP-binding domain-containing protein [Jatrophihabitantaceae bacterium]
MSSPRPGRRGVPPRARWSPLLRGRQKECEVLDAQLQQVADGHSAVLVLRGEAGIGKSALLDYTAERAADCRVTRAVGVQSEMELAFAGLHQLCAGLLESGDLQPSQRTALRVAFGLQEGGTPEPLAVAVAVLNLLSAAAEPRPLVCLIDDAQWLDRASAQALAFVARRLAAERILMIFAVREPVEVPQLAGLPELHVDGLPDSEARLLLASGFPGRVDEAVRDRFVAETRGNPLALLELPRSLSPADLAGGFAIPAGSLTGQLEQLFARRAGSLPPGSRDLLLLAAADPLGDVTLLWRAAEVLGIGPDAAAPAEEAGLIEIGLRVRFRHPLVRSATYQAASPAARQNVHRALAEATDADADPDRRAWHRAQATAGLDETVAAELEHSAARAQRRGGAAAAAAFLQRAAELTPGPELRGERALAAAQAKLDAAAPEAASALLAMAELCPLDDYRRALARRLRAQVAFTLSRGSDALPLLLQSADELAPFDSGLAREAVLEAFAAAVYAGHPGDDQQVQKIAAATLAAPAQSADAVEALVRGLATVFTQGFVSGAPALRTALAAVRRADENDRDVNRWLWLACRIAFDLWDERLSGELAERGLRLARETGALSVLPIATSFRAGLHLHAGEFDAASALMDESAAISEATGTAPLVYTPPILAAYRGDVAAALPLLDAADQHAAARGQVLAASMIGSARAVLFNGLARYDEALTAAVDACAHDGLGLYALGLVELIEAAVRTGRADLAPPALDRLAERTHASNTDWSLGIEARSRALLTEGPDAQALYEESLSRLSQGRVRLHLARTQLVYGEWLRREKRRAQAREQLRAAHELFAGCGAAGFAERARRELSAIGDVQRPRTADALTVLTPQEAQVARLAAGGMTNPEIGAQLFISPRTVEYHLRKVFAKLGLGSRKELRRAMGGGRVPGHAD